MADPTKVGVLREAASGITAKASDPNATRRATSTIATWATLTAILAYALVSADPVRGLWRVRAKLCFVSRKIPSRRHALQVDCQGNSHASARAWRFHWQARPCRRACMEISPAGHQVRSSAPAPTIISIVISIIISSIIISFCCL